MDLKKKKDKLIENNLCNHCLGRQFALLGTGLENYQRGYIVRNKQNLTEEDFKLSNLANDLEVGGKCSLCEGLFNSLEKYTNLVIEALQQYELDTILMGVRPTDRLKKKQEDLWEKYGSQHAEPLKKEFNRLIAKRLIPKLKVEPDFKRADIQVVVNVATDTVDLQVSSVLIYGQYNKYTRDISQTTWNYSNNSIQEIIQAPFIKAAEADSAKFHGGGREDLDVRCFGKRDFVLELIGPKKRDLQLKELTTYLNRVQSKVEIFNLEFVNPAKKREIKEKNPDKTYKALVHFKEKITKKDLNKLDNLVGTIEQRTPNRVNSTRTDKIRRRKVYKVFSEMVTPNKIEMVIKAEAGTYIKELISGDQNRTEPSVAGILNCEAECKRLDVISIDN